MRGHVVLLQVPALLLFAATAWSGETLRLPAEGDPLVTFQAEPLTQPKGGDKFKGSDFIHPLSTPSGFVITDSQPNDHLHHFGLWWPWKYLQVDKRKILCWELQELDGLIQTRQCKRTADGFTAESVYIDRKAPGGEKTILNETVNVRMSPITDQPTRGYVLDIEIIHAPAGTQPVTVAPYRYSGFALRGTASWNKDTSTVYTSEGKDYSASNTTRARWVRVEGQAGKEATAGVVLMSHPQNCDHPEKLRTWDPKQFNGAIFVNFNSVQEKAWVFEPGRTYTRKYRLFIYDGKVSVEQAEALWKDYAK